MRVLIVATLVLAGLAGCADEVEPVAEGEQFEPVDVAEGKGLIRGVVVDPAITPIANATVEIKSLEMIVQTSAEGAFQIVDLDPGAYFLDVSKLGWSDVQTSVQVEAGVASPKVQRILLEPNDSELPSIQPVQLKGHLTCGAAVFRTSVGCTTIPAVAEAIEDQSIFRQEYPTQPTWLQGELVWKSTQALSGKFIWEITPRTNEHIGYRETAASPALAYLNTTVIEENAGELPQGLDWRFFGGPHELCPATGHPNTFGCGVTLEQDVDVIIHGFYNLVPFEGWRFTEHGDHPIGT